MIFTAKQISDWRAYERVRKDGRWNMYDPNARNATGLSAERYRFVMQNFAGLKAQAEPQTEKP